MARVRSNLHNHFPRGRSLIVCLRHGTCSSRETREHRLPKNCRLHFPVPLRSFTPNNPFTPPHTPDALLSPGVSSPAPLVLPTATLPQTFRSSARSSTPLRGSGGPPRSAPNRASLSLSRSRAPETLFAVAVAPGPPAVAPARKAPSMSRTPAGLFATSIPPAPARPPKPLALLQKSQSCFAPGLTQARPSRANESAQLAPISPASNRPAAAKSPPNPVSPASQAPRLPGSHAWDAPPASSATPDPALSARRLLLCPYASLFSPLVTRHSLLSSSFGSTTTTGTSPPPALDFLPAPPPRKTCRARTGPAGVPSSVPASHTSSSDPALPGVPRSSRPACRNPAASPAQSKSNPPIPASVLSCKIGRAS